MNKIFNQLTALHSPPPKKKKPYAFVLGVLESGQVIFDQSCESRVDAEAVANRQRAAHPEWTLQIYVRGRKING